MPAAEPSDKTIVMPPVPAAPPDVPAAPTAAAASATPPTGPSPARAGLLADRRARALAGTAGALVALLVLGGVGLLLTRLHPGGSQPRPSATPTAVAASSIHASASSTQTPESGITYDATNTLDGNPATAWNSNGKRDGRGPGMKLTYTFDSPVNLRSITVLNGYQKVRPGKDGKTIDLFTLNERVHRLRVITDTGSWTWDLADDRTPQTLARSFGRTRTVQLEIVSVYRSESYLDVALSEVSFTAVP